MANEWAERPLDEITDVKSGKRLPKGEALVDYRTINPYLRLVDVSNGKIRSDDLKYLTTKIQQKIARYIVNTNDVCLAIVGHTIGMVFQIDAEYDGANLTENAARLTNFRDVDPKYVFHWLSSPVGQAEIKSRTVGSAQGKLPLYNIRSLPIPLPPLPEQRAIAHILGSLDDKIELNRQMNATLEGMAQALFKSWFVDFDPVIDNALAAGNPIPEELADRADVRRAALADGTANREAAKPFPAGFQHTEELGWIPEGWGAATLGDYLDIKRGGSPRPIHDYIRPEGLPWVKIADATKSGSRFLFETKEFIKPEGLSKTILMKKGSLILTNSATPGLPMFLQLDACIHDGWLHFPKKEHFGDLFLYQLFLVIREELVGKGNGSVFTNLKTDILRAQGIVVPPVSILDIFEKWMAPNFQRILQVNQNSRSLTKLRDTLLPKLISGELRIPDAEKLAEEALA